MTNNLPSTIGLLLLKQADLFADRKAIGWIESDEVKSYTFKEYHELIKILTSALIHHQVKVGDKVAILSQSCKEWHLMDMAVMCARACTVPVYPSYTAHEIEFIISHSDASVLVVENDSQMEKIIPFIGNMNALKLVVSLHELSEETVKKFRNITTYIDFKQLKQIGAEEIKTNPDLFENSVRSALPEEAASIIYTSGTTGNPKGALITQKAIIAMFNNVAKSTQGAFFQNDSTLTFLPLSHVLGRADSFFPLVFGWQSVYAESIEKVIDNLKLVRPTVMIAVPRIFEKIYHHVQENLKNEVWLKQKIFNWALDVGKRYYAKIDQDRTPDMKELIEYQLAYRLVFKKVNDLFGGRIRFFVSGGAPLSREISEFLKYSGLTVLEGYGLTETIAPCCLNPVAKQEPGTVGRPIGDVEFKFAQDGEILIKSKAMFQEYYKNPEASAEAFENGWFKSGDIGNFNNQGYLTITDRKKDIIITSAGKNIAPQKIENMAKLLPFISHFVVTGDKKKYLVALVGIEKDRFKDHLAEMNLSADCSLKDLAQHPKTRELIEANIEELNKNLGSFETIKKFHILSEELNLQNFLTPSLKIKRQKLVEHYKAVIEAMYQD